MPGHIARPVFVLAVAVLVGSAACTGAPPDADPPPTAEPESDAIRMAAVGDSITDADSEDLDGGTPGPQSWVSYAVGPDVEFVGGWAVWGASTAQMADGVEPVEADVLVILAGTNDAGWMEHTEIGTNIAAIVDAAGVPEVVLSSVPPIDAAPQSAADLNASLEDLADEQGWTWVDAAEGLREGDMFAEGMAYDGLHPTDQGARILGEAIGAAVRETGG